MQKLKNKNPDKAQQLSWFPTQHHFHPLLKELQRCSGMGHHWGRRNLWSSFLFLANRTWGKSPGDPIWMKRPLPSLGAGMQLFGESETCGRGARPSPLSKTQRTRPSPNIRELETHLETPVSRVLVKWNENLHSLSQVYWGIICSPNHLNNDKEQGIKTITSSQTMALKGQ